MKTLAEAQNLKRTPLAGQPEHQQAQRGPKIVASDEPIKFAKQQRPLKPSETDNKENLAPTQDARPNGHSNCNTNHNNQPKQQSNKTPAPQLALGKQAKVEQHPRDARVASRVQLDERPKVMQVAGGATEDETRLENAAHHAKQQQQQQTQQQQPPPPQQWPEPGLVKQLGLDFLLFIIKGLIAIYDLISQPIFYFKHDVRAKRQQVDELRSKQVDPSDPNSPWRQINIDPRQLDIEARIDCHETYDALMQNAFKLHADSPCYGYRQVLQEHWSKRAETGKMVRQVRLSDYKWCTYAQFEAQIEAARKGLLLEGVRAGHRVMLFADTRAEWQICSQALIRLGAVMGTMYSTLGADGIVHTVNETQATHVITQRDKVARLLALRGKLPRLRKIIYFEGSLHLPRELGGSQYCDQEELVLRQQQAQQDRRDFERLLGNANGAADDEPAPIELRCFSDLLEAGLGLAGEKLGHLEQENQSALELSGPRRRKDSLAVIMYTSGSTGIPKGVLISHGNIMANIKSFSYVTKDFVSHPRNNVCTAYLPLAHIFEFCIESVMLYHGVKFGFANPHTLTDKSPGLMEGQSGDLSLLKPTIMIVVPLILDRVVQGIKQTLRSGPYFKEQLVDYLIRYKIRWQQRHYETPLIDKLICSKISVALGGHAKWVICGSAPLSHQTQVYARAALNLKLPQGFGTTETCAATACQLFDDQSTQNVGLPVAGAQIRLEPWIEGNYRPTDRPNPRGEIVVGGGMIAQGYFNLEQQTREAFYTDEEGVRWYRTGDIGEFLPNGQLKIIDRKKDLVKLQNGEYISLGRVESTLKSNPYTDNFCVYADSGHNYVVALGPANEPSLKRLACQIIEEHERSLATSPSKRVVAGGGQQTDHNSNNNFEDLNQNELSNSSERVALLLTDGQVEASIEELRQILANYSQIEATSEQPSKLDEPPERRGSTLSSGSAGSPCNELLAKLCNNKLINRCVLAIIFRMGRKLNLTSLEIPKKLLLLAEEWTEDKNLVTAAMKIRRNFVYKRYQQQLDQLYSNE